MRGLFPWHPPEGLKQGTAVGELEIIIIIYNNNNNNKNPDLINIKKVKEAALASAGEGKVWGRCDQPWRKEEMFWERRLTGRKLQGDIRKMVWGTWRDCEETRLICS